MSFSEAEMAWCSIKKILEYLKDFQLCQTKTELKTSYQKTNKIISMVLNKYAKQGDKILIHI
jgi:hypothetical protein